MPTDTERLNFMIRKKVTMEFYRGVGKYQAWGFEGCSLVYPQRTYRRAIDAAMASQKRRSPR